MGGSCSPTSPGGVRRHCTQGGRHMVAWSEVHDNSSGSVQYTRCNSANVDAGIPVSSYLMGASFVVMYDAI